MDIAKIDSNFHVDSTLSQPDLIWMDPAKAPFRLYGAVSANPFLRMPQEAADRVSAGVSSLCRNTTGVRLRFRTDSPYIALHAEWDWLGSLNRMPLSGSSGFDLYRVEQGKHFYHTTFAPPMDCEKGYDSIRDTTGVMTEFILNFPLYNEVKNLYVGVKEGSHFEATGSYRNELPVVFYGSSITHGGCASRPGMCYESILSRALDMDYVNLGFSGNAKGERAIAEYIASLAMSAFVCDYDHNAPSVEHLQQTHYPLYEVIREKHPNIPYLILSKPDYHDCDAPRREMCFDTFRRAREAGDQNVYFIDGAGLFAGDEADGCTVDGCHPNDLGFYRMAQGILPVLKNVL